MMSRECKSFKDPAYGYIEIPSDWVRNIIDTEEFQRLRRIVQTSYEPLYPSATHNRFVHSLGVYHLGDIVAGVIKEKSFKTIEETKKGFTAKHERYLEIFRLACLLHDVGHAPFSHTGEDFFISETEKGNTTRLHRRITDLCGINSFLNAFKYKGDAAKPHELMSIIIALATFGNLFETSEEKTFFARAIAGYPYTKEEIVNDGADTSFLNCLISLLNSSVVDVDRLDYLIRDAVETGFKTVMIDYQRLLGGIRVRDINGECKIVFTKHSVSVLENVVFAHDAVKKWIQNHPAIAYEMEILKEAFKSVNSQFADDLPEKSIFCEEALTKKGVVLSKLHGAVTVKYLCDADIIFLMKNLNTDAAHSFFCRKERLFPLWKSEAEFFVLFSKDAWKQDLPRLMIMFERFRSVLHKLGIPEIDIDAHQKLRKEFSKACEKLQKVVADKNPKDAFEKAIVAGQRELFCSFTNMFRQFAKDSRIPFKFRILNAKLFRSGFETDDLSDMLIDFGRNNGDIVKFGNVTRVLGSRFCNSNLPNNVYYVYAKGLGDNKMKISNAFVNSMKMFIHFNSEKIDKFFKVDGKEDTFCTIDEAKIYVSGARIISYEK